MITYILPPKSIVNSRYKSEADVQNYYAYRTRKIQSQLNMFSPIITKCDELNYEQLGIDILIVEDEIDTIEDLLKVVLRQNKLHNIFIADNLATSFNLLKGNCKSPAIVTLDFYFGVINPAHKKRLFETVSTYREIKTKWVNTLVVGLTQNPTAPEVIEFSKEIIAKEDYFLSKDNGFLQILDIINNY